MLRRGANCPRILCLSRVGRGRAIIGFSTFSWLFSEGCSTFAGARAQQKASDDTTFRKLIDSYCAAWSSGNTANAAKFYVKDDNLVFYDVAPFSYSGWKEYDAGGKKNFLDSTESVSLTAARISG